MLSAIVLLNRRATLSGRTRVERSSDQRSATAMWPAGRLRPSRTAASSGSRDGWQRRSLEQRDQLGRVVAGRQPSKGAIELLGGRCAPLTGACALASRWPCAAEATVFPGVSTCDRGIVIAVDPRRRTARVLLGVPLSNSAAPEPGRYRCLGYRACCSTPPAGRARCAGPSRVRRDLANLDVLERDGVWNH